MVILEFTRKLRKPRKKLINILAEFIAKFALAISSMNSEHELDGESSNWSKNIELVLICSVNKLPLSNKDLLFIGY